MELRVLKYFIKIAEEENMTKAAQKLQNGNKIFRIVIIWGKLARSA